MDAVFRNTINTIVGAELLAVRAPLASYPLNQNLTLRLNVQNLADEEYVDRVGGGHLHSGAGPAADRSRTDMKF